MVQVGDIKHAPYDNYLNYLTCIRTHPVKGYEFQATDQLPKKMQDKFLYEIIISCFYQI